MNNQPVAIITGGGTGIGRATAIQLRHLNYRLVITGRREAVLHEAATALGGADDVVCMSGDASIPQHAAAVTQRTIERFGRIDVLVNNAGFAPLAEIDATDPGVLREVFDVNALGPAYFIAACWPQMKAQGSGRIVNISTLGTHDPFPGFFGYAAAKAAVNLMARSCAKEGAKLGIRAFAVAPGAVETQMLRANFPEFRVPKAACLSPEAVASLIIDCISGKYDARNGDTIFISAQTGIR